MVTTREGAEVTVDDKDEWTGLAIEPGQILEVFMGSTSYDVVSDVWAAFFVTEVQTDIDGSYTIVAHYFACEEEALANELSKDFGRVQARLHLCLSRPCMDTSEEKRLHVTRLRVWSWDTFKNTDYVPKEMLAQVKKWQKELKKGAKAPERLEPSAKKLRKPALKTPASPATPGGGGGSGLTEEMKESLRVKLKDVRKRTHGVDAEKDGGAGTSKAKPNEGAEDTTEEESCEYVPTPPSEFERLLTGTALPVENTPTLELPGRGGIAKGAKKTKGVTKDFTSRSLSGQLVLRAMQVVKARKKKGHRKSKKKSAGDKVARMLSKILTKDGKEKKSKKKDKKKKRKVIDGVIVSCSSSSESDGDSEDEDEEESETDLEAPIKKRSRDRPGSVLSMLTEHVRDQMDQASLADMPGESHSVTGGVKISSYFALHVKPTFPQHLRELREMHSLAATLDLLRQGDIARVGDSLAARFMALRQSMLDSGWGTARFMELHSMDEAAAAAPSLVLASRKHSRLVDKVHGKGGAWGTWNKGKGRNGWKGYGDHDVKGGKGKDGKKGKGKGGKGQGGQWDKKVNEWKDTKEKPDDK